MNTEELLALPENGTERWLIRGELWEKPMTRRNKFHSNTESRIVGELRIWLRQQPEPRGDVFSGEAGFRLRRDPDTTVGIDVAYVTAEYLARQSGDSTLLEGPPLVAVEILSPNDTQDEIDVKVRDYLAAGVELVWIVNPRLYTVTVFRRDGSVQTFDNRTELTAEPHLPGFRVPVSSLFRQGL
jgi:Uma2 family endonuclease